MQDPVRELPGLINQLLQVRPLAGCHLQRCRSGVCERCARLVHAPAVCTNQTRARATQHAAARSANAQPSPRRLCVRAFHCTRLHLAPLPQAPADKQHELIETYYTPDFPLRHALVSLLLLCRPERCTTWSADASVPAAFDTEGAPHWCASPAGSQRRWQLLAYSTGLKGSSPTPPCTWRRRLSLPPDRRARSPLCCNSCTLPIHQPLGDPHRFPAGTARRWCAYSRPGASATCTCQPACKTSVSLPQRSMRSVRAPPLCRQCRQT